MLLLVKVLFVAVVDSLSAWLSSFFSDVGNALSRSELLKAIMQQRCYRGGYRALLKLPHCTTFKNLDKLKKYKWASRTEVPTAVYGQALMHDAVARTATRFSGRVSPLQP
jgi:hypothetical protein